jgi:hypothetical protein
MTSGTQFDAAVRTAAQANEAELTRRLANVMFEDINEYILSELEDPQQYSEGQFDRAVEAAAKGAVGALEQYES